MEQGLFFGAVLLVKTALDRMFVSWKMTSLYIFMCWKV